MIETIISKDTAFLENAINHREKYFTRVEDFTRKRKLDYQGLAMMVVNLPRKSLSVEIEDLLERFDLQAVNYSKMHFAMLVINCNPASSKNGMNVKIRHFMTSKITKLGGGFA